MGHPQLLSAAVVDLALLRDTDRDGTVDERHDLLTDLNSPFGLAFADDTLYVAAADAVLAYDYQLGQNEITTPPRVLTLEESLEFARDDECVEVTPEKVRIRKVVLDATERGRAASRLKRQDAGS